MMKAGPGRSRPGLGYRRRRVASSPVRYAAAPARPPRAASAARAASGCNETKEAAITDHKTGTREEWLAALLNLAGQRVVVVGGTSGMGAATSERH